MIDHFGPLQRKLGALVSIEIVSCYQRFENNFVWTPLRVWKEVFHCQMFRFA